MMFFSAEIRKGILKSNLFGISSILLYLAMAASIIERSFQFDLASAGTLNAFLITLVNGNFFGLIFPVFSVVPYSFSLCDDLHSGYIKPILLKRSFREYFMVKAATAFIAGFLQFLLGFVLIFIMLSILYPASSLRMDHVVGAFSFVYERSLLLYCVVFIIHNSLFAGTLSLFGAAIAGYTQNRYFGMIIPVALYFTSMFIGSIFIIKELIKFLYMFIPTTLFKLDHKPLLEMIYDFVVLNGASLLIVFKVYKKWYASAPTSE